MTAGVISGPSSPANHVLQHDVPGAELGPALLSVLDSRHEELNGLLNAYVGMMPRGFQESLRAIIYYALSSEPRVLLNFSWAPAYDFEALFEAYLAR